MQPPALFENVKTTFPRGHAHKALLRSFVLDCFGSSAISILDIGGGKFPLFEAPPAGWRYVVNDISAHELGRLDGRFETLHADICGPIEVADAFDVVVSFMLAEHLKDGEAFYRNQYRLLKPGGMFVHLHPVLFSPPFVLNKLLPHKLGQQIVYALNPKRRERQSVFPAYYTWCTALDREIERRKAIGFRHVDRAICYRHGYFDPLPGLKQVNALFTRAMEAMDARALASYCIYFGIK